MENMILLSTFLVIAMNILSDGVSGNLYCEPRNVVVETDPSRSDLLPRYMTVKRCGGGIRTNSYQCFPTRFKKEMREVIIMPEQTKVQRTVMIHTECKEFCVCKNNCERGEEYRDGKCADGMRWDASSCSCKCRDRFPGSPGAQNGGKKSLGVTLQQHILTIGILAIIFIAVIIASCLFYRRKQAKKSHKYRFYHKVTWNHQSKAKLMKFTDEIDGKTYVQTRNERKSLCCFTGRGSSIFNVTESELMQNDEADGRVNSVDPEEGYEKEISDLSPKECYDLGYYAFKKDKYPLMLRWLKEAKEKFERGEDGWEQVEEARLYEYLSLAYFVAKNDFESAKECRDKWNQITQENGNTGTIIKDFQPPSPNGNGSISVS